MTPVASWIVMPVVDCLDYTLQAIEDCVAQEIEGAIPRVLVIDNGSSPETRRALEAMQIHSEEGGVPRVVCWFHNPPLGAPPFGTVNAAWNEGLDFCWRAGANEALVVNNDVRLHPKTFACLDTVMTEHDALFVSAVGVTEEDFAKAQALTCTRCGTRPLPPSDPTAPITADSDRAKHEYWCPNCHYLCDLSAPLIYAPAIWKQACDMGDIQKGGPDFSCFLISRECHEHFRFDPRFTYFGDNDYHHRLKLAGEGDRIFSVNVPYLHYGSRTINQNEALAKAHAKVFEAHRELYLEKWGGMPGEEKLDHAKVLED